MSLDKELPLGAECADTAAVHGVGDPYCLCAAEVDDQVAAHHVLVAVLELAEGAAVEVKGLFGLLLPPLLKVAVVEADLAFSFFFLVDKGAVVVGGGVHGAVGVAGVAGRAEVLDLLVEAHVFVLLDRFGRLAD